MEEIKIPKWFFKVLIKIAGFTELMAIHQIIKNQNPKDYKVRNKMFFELLDRHSDDRY